MKSFLRNAARIFGFNIYQQTFPYNGDEEENLLDENLEKNFQKEPAKKYSPFFIGRENFFINETGLRTIIEYYNQKYPERGEIHYVHYSTANPDFREEVAAQLRELRKINGIEPIKIILTSCYGLLENDPNHSHPYVLTTDKLISMRDDDSGQEDNPNSNQRIIAREANVKMVEQRYGSTSIQGDRKSCHFIAAAILKDLTKEDLVKVAAFEEEYYPLTKSLKYTQSGSHLDEMLDELTEKEVIKTKGSKTVRQYFEEHRVKENKQTRINEKAEKFQNYLLESPNNNEEFPSPSVTAAEILAKRKAEKEQEK
jgi:hypothetical protein